MLPMGDASCRCWKDEAHHKTPASIAYCAVVGKAGDHRTPYSWQCVRANALKRTEGLQAERHGVR